MAWREQLRPASFRGVPFFVSATELEGGRRGTLHEYASGEVPYFEDAGLKGPKHSVDAFVIGADYMSGRDRLKKALSQKGAGALVHPYLGTLQVACPHFRLRQARAEGGMARFSIEFVETGRNDQPAGSLDTRAGLLDAGAASFDSLSEKFVDDFDPAGLPDFDVKPLEASVSGFVNGVGGDLTAMLSRMEVDADAKDIILASGSTLRNIASQAQNYVTDPAVFADQLGGVLSDVSAISAGLHMPDTFLRRAGGVQLTRAVTTAGKVASVTLAAYQRRMSVAAAVRSVANEGFDSRDEAVTRLSGLSAAVLREATAAADAGSHGQYLAMMNIRQAMVEDLTAKSASLRPLMTVDASAPLPADVLAYQLYGDATRSAEVAVRNGARNPLFMIPGSVRVLAA